MLGFVFPGQGSQYAGMGRQLIDVSDKIAIFFEYLSDYLEIDIKKICCDLTEEELRQTENAQIALYAYCMGLFEVIKETGILDRNGPVCFAGHSVGEYAALVAAGALSIDEGAALVYRRGQIMSDDGESQVGSMAAILGSPIEVVEAACNQVKEDQILVVANYNSASQVVVSGETEALERLISKSNELNLKKVIRLNVSGAFHSPLMEKCSETMSLVLRQARFCPTNHIVFSNVTGDKVDGFLDWSHLLEEQIKMPVLWDKEVENMMSHGVNEFIEVGPKKVLSGLIKKIVPDYPVYSIQHVDDIQKWQDAHK